MSTNTAWSSFSNTAIDSFDYTPGEGDITNLGLLTSRAILASDPTSSTYAGVVKANETAFLASPSATTMATAYGAATLKYLQLPAKSKPLPGYDDSPTWTEMTDDPDEKVGRTYTGKPEKITTLEYALPANIALKTILDKYYLAGAIWTLVQCYDDPKETDIFYTVFPHCRILGVGGNNGENNAAGEFTVRFQAEGGIYVPCYVTQARVTT